MAGDDDKKPSTQGPAKGQQVELGDKPGRKEGAVERIDKRDPPPPPPKDPPKKSG